MLGLKKYMADSRAQCICRLQFGRCKKNECAGCSHGQHFMTCYSNMNDYDKMRTDNRIAQLYGRYSLDFESFMDYKHVKSMNCKLLIVFFVMLFLLIGLCVMGNAFEYKERFTDKDIRSAPEPKVKATHQDASMETVINVRRVLRIVQETVYDINGDGLVNCIDHAVLFKVNWDKYFPDVDCILVENINPNVGMAHLFVAVFDYKLFNYVDVEPWACDIDVWQMTDRWGKIYDKWYNIYGEEDKWLRKAGVR